MKIVIFGLTITSSWGNGHATIWRGLCRALGARGHRIVFFERDVPYYAQSRDLGEIAGLEVRLYRDWEDVRHQAAIELSDAETGIVTSYCPDGAAASELVLSAGHALHVFYDLDTPVTLAAVEAGEKPAYIGPRGLGDFDLVLSYTGGKAVDLLKEKLGAREVRIVYGCADPEVHRPVEPVPEYGCLFSYLGTYAADRQNALEQFFIEPARQMPNMRFVIGGSQYPADFPWTPNIWYLSHIAPAMHPAFFCSSLFTLNITRGTMARLGYCPSARLFEAAACGTPIISDKWQGLEQFLIPGEEIVTVGTSRDAIDALGMDQHERETIARRGKEKVMEEHTAGIRAKEMENILAEALAVLH